MLEILDLYLFLILFFTLASPFIFLRIIIKSIRKSSIIKNKELGKQLTEKKFFSSLALIIPALILNIGLANYFVENEFILRLLRAWLIIAPTISLGRLISALADAWRKNDLYLKYPLRNYLHLFKLILYILSGIVAFCQILNLSPWGILSGIGAVGAILLLVFKDTILGLVASIQVYGSGLVKEGDWIELRSLGIDGEIVELGLHRVKVKAWDNSIMTFPTSKFLDHTFKNWRGMEESGGRRIKRSILIDQTSIKFLTKELENKLHNLDIMRKYLKDKETELQNANEGKNKIVVNRRTLTNIGCYRTYMKLYLEKHPKINKKMTLLTRQLKVTQFGLPIEVYAFTNTTNWTEYENIQSDVFDHLISAVSYFDLRIFQYNSLKDLTLSNEVIKN